MQLMKQMPENPFMLAVGFILTTDDLRPLFQGVPEKQVYFRIGNTLLPETPDKVNQLSGLQVNKGFNVHVKKTPVNIVTISQL